MKRIITIISLFALQISNGLMTPRRELLRSAAFGGGTLLSASIHGPINNPSPIPIKEEVGILQETYNELYFYGPVNQRSCFELKKQMNDMNIKLKTLSIQYHIEPPPIHLHIQSEGGSLYHTLYMIDLIRNIDCDVYTYIDGFAASAATLMSVVGKKRFMTKNSLMLIHQLSGSESGKYEELKDQMNNMSILMDMILNIYLEETKLNKNKLQELLGKDLWLNANTCLQYGLVDEII